MANPPALTTLFTPPPSFLSDIYAPVDFGFYVLGNPFDTADCLPDGFNYAQTSYFSPAPQCPAGYTQACASTNTIGGTTETMATCCPTGYQCRISATDAWGKTFSCSLGFTSNTVVVMTVIASTPGTVTSSSKTVNLRGGDGLNAFSVQIRWQSTDFLPASTSSPTASGKKSHQTKI